MFDGHDADPAAWLTANYASFEAFTSQVNALRGTSATPSGRPTKSGSPKDADKNGVSLSAEDTKRLERLGYDPKFVGITNAADLPARDEKE